MAQTCFRHSRRETNLKCGHCGRPICSECLTHTDVGIRCPVCIKEMRPVGFDVSPAHFILATMAAIGVGAAGGTAHGFLLNVIWLPFFLSVAFFLLVAYLIGETVARLIGVRRSTGLQVVAGFGVVVASVLTTIVKTEGRTILDLNPFTVVIVVIAIAVATSRIR